MDWFNYLIQVNIYLTLFFCFFKLVLQNETFFKWNRIFLVSSGILSFLIPTLQSPWVKNLFVTKEIVYVTEAITLDEIKLGASQASGFSWLYLIMSIYAFGVFFYLCRFLWQLSQVSKSFKQPNQALSFFTKVSVSETLSSRESIIKHEEVHASQLHSADVIIFEIVGIINWFNPVAYAYKKAVKFIHEFIADEVASTEKGKSEYALLLVSNVFGIQKEQLANNFYNQSLLKKRIMMLHKPKSKKVAVIKYWLSAPLFALMIILSSATISQKEIASVSLLRDNKIINPILKDIATNSEPLEMAGKPSQATRSFEMPAEKEFSSIKGSDADTSEVYSQASIDILPEYPGGTQEFLKWIGANYKYPDAAKEKQMYGRMAIEFIVEKNGKLNDIKILRDLGYGTGEEAVRLLSTSRLWKPGIQNGRPVRVKYVLPIQLNMPIEIGPKQTLTIKGPESENIAYFLDGKAISKAEVEKLSEQTIKSIKVIKESSEFGNLKVPEGTKSVVQIETK